MEDFEVGTSMDGKVKPTGKGVTGRSRIFWKDYFDGELSLRYTE